MPVSVEAAVRLTALPLPTVLLANATTGLRLTLSVPIFVTSVRLFAPIVAVQNLMKKEGKTIADYDLIEANEAFAVQAIADGRALGWDWSRVNVNGGAVALGHPIGASGARVLTTLLYAMAARNAATGLATLCLGGGNAVALSVERLG